ncbi:MAG: HDOD domain-containing protein [Planctomycetes bacterium]|nr:HDOD domain-containing protein [Planctomycetota bacterium]
MTETWIGRQPIFDRQLSTHAYELLFRSPHVASPSDVPGSAATAQVIVGALADVGLDRVVGPLPAFVNVTRAFVVGEYPLPLPPERVVLELLEDIDGDREVLLGVERLRSQGFKLALDDVTDVRPGIIPLLRRVDLVKVECLHRSPDDLAAIVERLRPFQTKLLAEKLETQRELEVCQQLGFDYFQGYFLERPNVVKTQVLSPVRLQLLKLLAELQAPDASFERIEETVRVDLALSVKLLSCANSAMYGVARRIDTVRDAVVLLGLENTRNLVTLILLSRIEDKPPELLLLAMTRARMCESLAQRRRRPDPRSAFTVGMFSLLDAILDQPMTKILDALPLGVPAKEALTERKGDLGNLLDAVVGCERGDWIQVERHLGEEAPVFDCFLDSVAWATEIRRTLVGSV